MFVSRHHGPAGLPIASSFLFSLMSQMLWWASPAEAQGFFQQLLGLSSAPQVQVAPRPPSPRQPVGGAAMRIPFDHDSAGSGRSPRWSFGTTSGGREGSFREGSGSYTTMCVRMCDGYYFPISHRVPRGRFHRDADICRTRCDQGDARLFYHSSSGEDMKSAVDLTGRAYARLPIAFMHRKKRVVGCGCRPEPWSVEALVRHEGYAIAEGVTVRGTVLAGGSSRGQGTLTVVAGNYAAPATESKTDDAGRVDSGVAENSSGPTPQAAGETVASSGAVPEEAVAAEPQKPAANGRFRSAAGKQKQARRPSVTATASSAAKQSVAAAARSKPTRMASAAPSGGKLVWPGDPR